MTIYITHDLFSSVASALVVLRGDLSPSGCVAPINTHTPNDNSAHLSGLFTRTKKAETKRVRNARSFILLY